MIGFRGPIGKHFRDPQSTQPWMNPSDLGYSWLSSNWLSKYRNSDYQRKNPCLNILPSSLHRVAVGDGEDKCQHGEEKPPVGDHFGVVCEPQVMWETELRGQPIHCRVVLYSELHPCGAVWSAVDILWLVDESRVQLLIGVLSLAASWGEGIGQMEGKDEKKWNWF